MEISTRARLRAGDQAAFAELFDRYAAAVHHHAFRLTGNWSTAAADAALAVGSVSKQDTLSDFSSRGPRSGDLAVKPDLAAPGEGGPAWTGTGFSTASTPT